MDDCTGGAHFNIKYINTPLSLWVHLYETIDQTYNFAPCVYASRLAFTVPSNTHPIAAAHKVSSGHAMNMTMNAYESVGLVPFSSNLKFVCDI